MKIPCETSQKIRNMGLLCAILVVCFHVPWPHDKPLSVGWFIYQAFGQGGIANIAVPFFFVVSGFFIAMHFNDTNWYKHEISKRVKTLVVPFVFWSVFSIVSYVTLNIVADIISHRPFGTSICILHDYDWVREIGLDFSQNPNHYPLWYVRCLLLFALTAFGFKYCVSRFGYIFLAVAFAFDLLTNHIPNETIRGFFLVGYSLRGVFYFSVGVFLQQFPPRAKVRGLTAFCGIAGIALLAMKMVLAFNAWPFEACIGKLSVLLLLYFAWKMMPSYSLPQWLTSCSFPIFLMHSILLLYMFTLIKYIPIDATVMSFVGFIVCTIIPIGAAVVLRRFLPHFANVIFGGR